MQESERGGVLRRLMYNMQMTMVGYSVRGQNWRQETGADVRTMTVVESTTIMGKRPSVGWRQISAHSHSFFRNLGIQYSAVKHASLPLAVDATGPSADGLPFARTNHDNSDANVLSSRRRARANSHYSASLLYHLDG